MATYCINKVTLLGYVGNDPEIKLSQSNSMFGWFSVAVSEHWKDKATGQPREKTEWVKVVVSGKLAEIASKHVHRGSRVYLEGALQTDNWTTADGQERSSKSVRIPEFSGTLLILDSKASSDVVNTAPAVNTPAVNSTVPQFDDDIPF